MVSAEGNNVFSLVWPSHLMELTVYQGEGYIQGDIMKSTYFERTILKDVLTFFLFSLYSPWI